MRKELFLFLTRCQIYLALGLISLIFILGPNLNSVLAASLGEKVVFSVDSAYDATSREKISATLRQAGQKAYFYIEDEWWQSLSASQQSSIENALSNLSREFDQVIYPKMTAVYGSEWKPGIDNDERITILVTKMIEGAGGYFNNSNEYPKAQVSFSNEREMVYLNSLYIENQRNSAFLAHEFQHLITFYQKTKLYNLEEDYWLNEARSEYAPTLLGYDNPYTGSNLEKRVRTFLGRPSDSLTEWRNESSDYGVVNLFIQYLVDHYGTRILTLMTQNNKVGIASVEVALQALGASETFADIFTNWVIANYLNDCSLSPVQKYCYLNSNLTSSNLRVLPTSSYTLGQASLEIGTWTKDWSARWYKFESSDSQLRILQVNFEGYGSTGNFKIPYILIDNNNLKKIYLMSLNYNQEGGLLISNFGSQVKSIVLIPINQFKRDGFTSNDPNTPFSLKISTLATGIVLYPDNTLIKATNEPKVYLIENGLKRWIPSAEIFIARGFKWQDIKVVSSSDVSLYPEGKTLGWPDGILMKSANSPTVYIVSLEKKRAFVSAEIFSGLGYQWGNIKVISQDDLDNYDLGTPVNSLFHPDGTLIKFTDSPNVYLIEGGKKRLIPSAEIFLSKGYNFNSVVIVNPAMRSNYPDGQVLSTISY